nr:TonB-dependent receptor plug domain-containing protein [Melioribacteraceae bacterium]
MNDLKYFIFFCVVGMFFISQPLYSQKTDSLTSQVLFNMSLEDLMDVKVTSVSKYEQNLSAAPASVMVITEDEIKNNIYHFLSDVLKDISFIDIVDNARGFGELYTIKGIEGNDRFLVLIDGKKLNQANGSFLSVGNSISVSFAERIEIISGPSSAIYGADAFSGIINIISNNPSDGVNVDVKADYGSFNSIHSNINIQYN